MAYLISIDDVKAFISTTMADSAIQLLIDSVDEADACLTAGAYSEAQGRRAKIYGVCALIESQKDGQIVSQSSFTGDSVSYANNGTSKNKYISLLNGMDAGSCVLSAIGMGSGWPAMVIPA